MPKGKLLEDTFEQLVELGQGTVKKAGQAVTSTVSPQKMVKTIFGQNENKTSEVLDKNANVRTSETNKNKKHTPLDFEKLQKKFQDSEKQKANALRRRLFDLVRQGDEKILLEKRQKEMEKKRQEALLSQEKKRKEKEKKRKQASPLPLGKVRRSIFSTKKVVEREHMEMKPATGKQ